MVQDFLKKQLETKGRRLLIPQEAGLAIVKGAVLFGHQPSAIESRILRYTYGFNLRVPFKEGIHPESNKVVEDDGQVKCKGAFRPFVNAGTSVTTGEVIKKTITLGSRETDSLVVYYRTASDVILTNDRRLNKLFSIKLRDILPNDAENRQPMTYQFMFGETEVESEILLPKMNFCGKVSYKFKLQ
ncbi:hypothetical protein FSP39_003325 [Pinctada imbricata]|uniref:Uncharacterized protein n=1 Tax=Pinctada imbricata TaxID=66713 RepID=A0AA89BS45_PINIB|nr:hypothetical protein FSP39_003325 [Pinctada imbricata]